ncbi:MAG: hypothetical protein GXP31_02655 [Kiritimatiellaeota bacterium]|nr:hypothetical protein [Kiritimatiellota bacterium]
MIKKSARILTLLFAGVWLTAAAQDVAYPTGGEGGTNIPDNPGGEGHVLTAEELARLRKMRVMELAGTNARQALRFTIRRLVLRMSRHVAPVGGRTLRGRRFRQAGPVFQNIDTTFETAYAGIRVTSVDASGYSFEENASVSADIGDQFHGGLTLTKTRTYLNGPFGSEVGTLGTDAYLNMDLGETFSLGVFGTTSMVDVEEVNGNGATYGGGATLSAYRRFGGTVLTATGSITRLFQDVSDREYDTTASGILDVQHDWTDSLSTSTYAYFSDSLRQNLPGDRCFWSAGLEFLYQPLDRLELTLGYEKTFALNDYREFRINAGLTWSW